MRRQAQTFHVKFEPLPRVEGIRALRALLKAALRRFGLRAVEVREERIAAAAATPSEHHRCGSDQARRSTAMREKMKPNEDMRKYAGSTFLRLEDLANGPRETEMVDVEDGKYGKPVAEFSDGSKLALNGTNCRTLCRDLGPLCSAWLKKRLQLYIGEVKFEGKVQPSILIRVLDPVPVSEQTQPPPTPASPAMDDEIPF